MGSGLKITLPDPDKQEPKPFHREGAKVAKEILQVLKKENVSFVFDVLCAPRAFAVKVSVPFAYNFILWL